MITPAIQSAVSYLDANKDYYVRTAPGAQAIAGAGFAAAYQAGSAPAGGTSGGKTNHFPRVRTNITYAGSVTAAVIRLYTRLPGGSMWFRGPSSDDDLPLTGVNESRDWLVGAGVECLFVLESVSPGTNGNTVAVDVVGVS